MSIKTTNLWTETKEAGGFEDGPTLQGLKRKSVPNRKGFYKHFRKLLKKTGINDRKVAAWFFLSFLRKQESMYIEIGLDPRLRGDDKYEGD